MMSKFIHLQTKSHYSIVSGLPKTNQIIDKAVESGMKAVALTDKNTFFGLVKFYNYAINEGIKPICGVDFDLRNKFGRSHILLYAKNKKGLEVLFNLSTKAFVLKLNSTSRPFLFLAYNKIWERPNLFLRSKSTPHIGLIPSLMA